MISVTRTSPVFGPAVAAITGQSPPEAATNSSLSLDERKHLRPVTALAEPDPAEPEPRIIGPQIGPLAEHKNKDARGRKEQDDDQPQDLFQLSGAAVDRLIEADPALERLIRSEMARETSDDADAPVDQAAFRARVIEYLKSVYADDPAFQRALKSGTIVVRQVGDEGNPDLQPQRTYTIYRSGAMEGAASEAPGGNSGTPDRDNIGKNDFIAWWPQ